MIKCETDFVAKNEDFLKFASELTKAIHENQEITNSDGEKITFAVDSFKKHCLLNGLDDIGLTLQKESSISSYEKEQKASEPWLYP